MIFNNAARAWSMVALLFATNAWDALVIETAWYPAIAFSKTTCKLLFVFVPQLPASLPVPIRFKRSNGEGESAAISYPYCVLFTFVQLGLFVSIILVQFGEVVSLIAVQVEVCALLTAVQVTLCESLILPHEGV